jgi:long-chain acyl-CoA synthetase
MAEPVSGIPPTLAQLPFFVGGRFPRPDLLGRCESDRIVYTSGREFLERVRDLGLGLQSLGMAAGDRVVLLAESRPDWLLADFAILTGGAATVPVYPTLSPEQVAFIVRDSGAGIAVVSTPAQLAKLMRERPALPDLRTIVMVHITEDELAAARAAAPDLAFVTFAELAERGNHAIRQGWGIAREFQERAKRIRPDDLATVIYTSGTTGEPKGVMLTHGNLIANLRDLGSVFDLSQDDVALSFLPLCHGFERMVAYVYLSNGVSMTFAESLDTVARDLKRIRPTVMSGVPRVYEKLHARVEATVAERGGVNVKLFRWASNVAEQRGVALSLGRSMSPWLLLQSRVAERLVFQRIREGVGGRLRFAVSGSAPLSEELGRWFRGVGLPILEGYGLTETSPVLTVTPLRAIRFGKVGPPLPGVELRIAEDGEILARGANVMRGYFNRDSDTEAVIRDGWFHTGDIGEIDEHGYLKITDRKKELLVTSGGKKIAPQPIEAALRAQSLVAEAVLVGDRRHFPAALIVPNLTALAARLGVQCPQDEAGRRALLGRADVQSLYGHAVDHVNATLAQFERIKKFHLLPREFTQEAGDLTPTLKVKRAVVEAKYRAEIEAMYA